MIFLATFSEALLLLVKNKTDGSLEMLKVCDKSVSLSASTVRNFTLSSYSSWRASTVSISWEQPSTQDAWKRTAIVDSEEDLKVRRLA